MALGMAERTLVRVTDLDANALLARHARMTLTLAGTAAASAHGTQGAAALMFHRGHRGYADFVASLAGRPHVRSAECCATLFRRADAAELLVSLGGESARRAAARLRALGPGGELPLVLLTAGRTHLARVPVLGDAALVVGAR